MRWSTAMAVPSRSTTSIMIGGPDFKLKGVYLEDETMQPIRLQRSRAEQRGHL